MPQPLRRKKLYFDVSFQTGPSGTTMMASPQKLVFPCTQFRANYTGGDRYGALLDDLPALTGGSDRNAKRRNEVAAWFQPYSGYANTGDSPTSNATNIGQVRLDFVQATTNATGASPLPYLTAGGTQITNKYGMTPVFTRHFGVRVQRFGLVGPLGDVFTTHGILYVHRQHSIEI